MILVIDNYDSFTYNVVEYLKILGEKVVVKKNDTDESELQKIQAEKIIISPGPSHPQNAGVSPLIIQSFLQKIPVLGICLGHQCLAHQLGAKIKVAKKIYHGKPSTITHNGENIFQGIPNPFTAIRYHSLVIDKTTLPKELEVTAYSEDNEIMAIRHKNYPVYGLQFHPESIGSTYGMEILKNFLQQKREK